MTTLNNEKTRAQDPLPSSMSDLVASFIRALNTARLYAKSHDLLKKQNQQLYTKLKEAISDRDFLYFGCAKDSFFMEGTFYQAKETNHHKFLEFFHSLRISNILINKEIAIEDIERVSSLFMDISEATQHLKKYEEKMMIH